MGGVRIPNRACVEFREKNRPTIGMSRPFPPFLPFCSFRLFPIRVADGDCVVVDDKSVRLGDDVGETLSKPNRDSAEFRAKSSAF